MITQFNEVTHKHEWVLVRWYDKALYIYGFVSFWLYAIGFVVGFFAGLLLATIE